MTAYYNELDPYVAKWLRNLIAAGHIAPGDVDERSIEDVRPDDLAGYTQCHFFAGIGVWSYALRRAGWPDDRPVWTGSCPCQPFSQAGEGAGFADERHLWPAFFHLIGQRRPATVLGEQVASKDAEPWIDLVCSDLGSLGYASGAIAFPSAGVGAPHIRDRLYWVADADGGAGGQGRAIDGGRPARSHAKPRAGLGGSGLPVVLGNAGNAGNEGLAQRQRFPGIPGREARADEGQAAVRASIHAGGLAHAHGRNAGAERQQRGGEQRQQQEDGGTGLMGDAERKRPQGCSDAGCGQGMGEPRAQPAGTCADGRMAHAASTGRRPQRQDSHAAHGVEAFRAGQAQSGRRGAIDRPGPANGFWRTADWLLCRDGRWRPVEPGTQPLAHGAAARVGRLRAFGNALNAEAAQAFIEAVMEAA